MALSPQQTAIVGADSARKRRESTLPRNISPWRLERLAARGRYTEIYAARPATVSGNGPADYAVKLLKDAYHAEPEIVGLFRREAAAGSQVTHPHLISVLSARVSCPPFYLVMPWLRGANLRALMTDRRGLCLPAMLGIIRQAAEALSALCNAGWIHGDVKPDNIMVSPEGHATLIDLGFARRADEAGWAAEQFFCGTFDYVAPEVITTALTPDVRSDLYSLGVTMFELLSGRLPFAADTAAELARRRVEDLPADIHKLEPELPLDLVRLLRAMLAKQPLRRPQSPAEVVDRLVRLEIETFRERTSIRNRSQNS